MDNWTWGLAADRQKMESLHIGAAEIRQGDRVRLAPGGRAGIFDLALAGRTAKVEAIEQALERRVYLSVALDDEPAGTSAFSGSQGTASSSDRRKSNP
jgi:hypothetical protein